MGVAGRANSCELREDVQASRRETAQGNALASDHRGADWAGGCNRKGWGLGAEREGERFEKGVGGGIGVGIGIGAEIGIGMGIGIGIGMGMGMGMGIEKGIGIGVCLDIEGLGIGVCLDIGVGRGKKQRCCAGSNKK